MRSFALHRTTLALVALAALFAGSSAAAAQEVAATPQPHITSAPHTVRFGTMAPIEVRLEDGAPGDRVTLQQRRSTDDPWRDVATKAVDDRSRTTFKRQDMRRSTVYRAVFEDHVAEVRSTSEWVRVRVKSRLTMRVIPKHAVLGNRVKVKGRLLPIAPGRRVVVQQKSGGEWKTVTRTRVDRDGYYRTRFEARVPGHRKVRAVFRGDSTSVKARTNGPLTVYRRELATWYGPGFYGNRTACGQTLTTETLGVAHRTLPCGTRVSLLFGGRTVSVRVIDRGPFTNARWDLTKETADRLGFSGKQDVGVAH